MPAVISAFATWLWGALGSSIVLTLLAVVFQDVIFGIVAAVLGMAVNAINDVGFTLPTIASAIDLLPLQVLQIMKRIGIDDCLAIIVSAYTIRTSLKLYGWARALKPRT